MSSRLAKQYSSDGRRHETILVFLFLILGFSGTWILLKVFDQSYLRKSHSYEGSEVLNSQLGTPESIALDFNVELKNVANQVQKKQLETALQNAKNDLRDFSATPNTQTVEPPNFVKPVHNGAPSELREFVENSRAESSDPLAGRGYLQDFINSRLANRQFMKDYERKYRDEFIKEFIKNARRDGLDPVIDQNLRIVDVRPYRPQPKTYQYRQPNSVGSH